MNYAYTLTRIEYLCIIKNVHKINTYEVVMYNFDSTNVLGFLGESIAVNVLVYLSLNQELLKNPHFDCAYKIARLTYVKRNFGNCSLNSVKELFDFRLNYIVSNTKNIHLDMYKRDTYYLAELIERYDISKNYIDVIEDYS